MADLNEQVKTVVKKTYDRAYKIRVDNPLGGTPKITFEVQTVTLEDGKMIGATPKSIVTCEFDPTADYPIINPLDDSVIAESGGSHAAVQVQLYSLFKHLVPW